MMKRDVTEIEQLLGWVVIKLDRSRVKEKSPDFT